MSFIDGFCISSIIAPYIDKYQTIYDFPLLKYIINPEYELNSGDDDLRPLHSCYEYYRKKFETLEYTHPEQSKKSMQTVHIANMIKKYCILEGKQIHETCCGLSVLGETLLDTAKHCQLIGYDINDELLAKNTKQFAKKLKHSTTPDNTNANTNNAGFQHLDMLKDIDKLRFTNNGNEITTCLHGCGQLHRNLITSLIEQQYNGAFFIIPCCYHRFTDDHYKLYNYDMAISTKLLKTVALSSNDTATLTDDHKHTKQLLMNIKVNLLVKHLMANGIITPEIGDSNYFVECIRKHGYFTLKKIPVNDTEENNWKKILKTIFEYDTYAFPGTFTYNVCKDIILEQQARAQCILDKILFEKHNILVQLTKLVEWLIMIDNVIYIQEKMPKHKVFFEQFISVANTPRNLIICGVPI
jgi:hypothetical protein